MQGEPELVLELAVCGLPPRLVEPQAGHVEITGDGECYARDASQQCQRARKSRCLGPGLGACRARERGYGVT